MEEMDMRQRIDRRRREQFEKFTRALGEVSPTHFMDVKAGASCLDLQLSGAIPPITEARAMDTAGKAAIVQSERQAAKTLIQKGRQESLASKQAVVIEARQIRSAQWRLQNLRPPSVDSTHDGSIARSPWSDQSDWASSNGRTPTWGARSSSAGTQLATRSQSPMPAAPLGKAFEDMLQNYYRTLEEIRDNEFAEAQRARQEEDEILHREHVRREHFEMQHRRREFAIVHELHRRERRRVFDASRTVLVIDRLAEEQRKRRFELHLRQERAKEQREQSRQRRAKYESHFDFILSQEALDRACGKVDMQKHWQTQRADTKDKVEKRKEKWATKSRPLRARRLFQQEQKRICNMERERQHALRAARERALREREFEQKKENVRMAHLLKAIMRGWRESGRNKSKSKAPEFSEDEPASAVDVSPNAGQDLVK